MISTAMSEKNVKKHFKIKRYVEHFVMNKISFHFTKIALILFSLYDFCSLRIFKDVPSLKD